MHGHHELPTNLRVEEILIRQQRYKVLKLTFDMMFQKRLHLHIKQHALDLFLVT